MLRDTDNERSYVHDRLIVDRAGYKVIYTSDSKNVVPWTCDICDAVMRSQDDEESHERFKCCSTCAARWAAPDVVRWNSGWRPSRADCQAIDRFVSTSLTF